MSETIKATIKELQEQLRALEEEGKQIKTTVNLLCKRAGIAPIYADGDFATSAPGAGEIKPDTFYGQPLNTCIRDYLERRKAAGHGPATAREIWQALTQGGFQFNAKNEENAMRSLRITLSKATHTFHKLPNGAYGMLKWYPNVKPAKPAQNDDEVEDLATLEDVIDSENESKGGDDA